MNKVCIFAGTSEGRQLISRLSGRGAEITACVATEYGERLLPQCPDVRILSGRMDAEEMKSFFRNEHFSVIVDATHPYADRATENILQACGETEIPYLRLQRPASAEAADGVFLPDAAACANYLRGTEGNILLTTGSKDLPVFCADASLRERLYARVLPLPDSLKICAECGLPPERIIAMQGPFDEDFNRALLRAVHAKYLVTKDGGAAGGYEAKIHAAMAEGAQAIILGRPPQREGHSLEQMVSELEKRLSLAPVPKHVTLAGIGIGAADTRTLGLERALREADCLLGARRMLHSVDCAGKDTFEAFQPREIADYIQQHSDCRRFLVLLSGDPGFYSGAKKLRAELQSRGIPADILPGISSPQYFCARLGRPWEDMRLISLHGREENLIRAVRLHPAVFALTGGEGGTQNALTRLVHAGLGHLSAAVGERLGYPEERISTGTVEELAERSYDTLSVLLVENPNAGDQIVTHGLPEEAFDREDIPMTKSEVRSVSLSKLALTQKAIVYDIGSGSGSVSVEAALQAQEGRVYAIEKNPQAAALTRRNAQKFHLENVEVIEGTAPEALSPLPPPTHAFIGGSDGSLREIIACLTAKNPAVRIVANAVTLESIAELSALSRDFDHCDIAEISVSKPRSLGSYRLMTAQNPVYIFAMWNEGSKAE